MKVLNSIKKNTIGVTPQSFIVKNKSLNAVILPDWSATTISLFIAPPFYCF